MAEVTVVSPGTGIVNINGEDISYFKVMSARRMVSPKIRGTKFQPICFMLWPVMIDLLKLLIFFVLFQL